MNVNNNLRLLLFSLDAGPRETLIPLLVFNEYVNCTDFEIPCPNFDWVNELGIRHLDGVILSTSRTTRNQRLENDLIRAANQLSLFVAVIEDYPYNFEYDEELIINMLLVESEIIKKKYLSFDKKYANEIEEGALVRYQAVMNERKLSLRNDCVLWIGQPETNASIEVLERLLPIIGRLNLRLKFRSHPRDIGYKDGMYSRIFKEYSSIIEDVSNWTPGECIKSLPILVATRYSSLAILAGYYGIPSVHLLYDDNQYENYGEMYPNILPIICQVGASFLITSVKDQEIIFRKAIFDNLARDEVILKFDKNYRKSDEYVHYIRSLIYNSVLRHNNEKNRNTNKRY